MTTKEIKAAIAGLVALLLLMWGQARSWIIAFIATVLSVLFPPVLIVVLVWAIWKVATGQFVRKLKEEAKQDGNKPDPAPDNPS